MSILDWFKTLGKPEERSVPVRLKIETDPAKEQRRQEIKEIQVRINMLQEEAEVILRR